MSKDTFYFSHDYNARSDTKIKKLIRVHGMPGYGIFWSIIEDLYNNANALQSDYEGIAYDLRADCDIVKSIINDFDLFVFENGSFGSVSIEKRLDDRNDKSEKARQSAFKRWGKVKSDANAMRPHSDGNAIKESIEKESIEKEKKEKSKYSDFVSMFSDEYQKLITEHGEENTKLFIKTLDVYKGANGKRYKDDYRAILSWVIDKCKKEAKYKTLESDLIAPELPEDKKEFLRSKGIKI